MTEIKNQPKSKDASRTKLFISNTRKALGMSQKDFGDMIGKNNDVISKYEAGIIVPPGDLILKICEEVLGLDISSIWL